jgi:hypothetical protein
MLRPPMPSPPAFGTSLAAMLEDRLIRRELSRKMAQPIEAKTPARPPLRRLAKPSATSKLLAFAVALG